MIQDPPFDLFDYDYYLFQVSSGKDSLAMWLRCLDLGVPLSKCEWMHQDVDGQEGSTLFDWPCTKDYTRKLAAHFGVPLFFQWRKGGLEREMLRDGTATAPTRFEVRKALPIFADEPPTVMEAGGDGPRGTRRKYPQPGWCPTFDRPPTR